ncbi:MAG: DNA glycosylase [Clostridia bacterium]|nr:DNA glycosylase [Clostridia bacterium]
MDFRKDANDILVENTQNFCLDLTLNCGQAFRWKKENDVWSGVIFGKVQKIRQNGQILRYLDTDEDFFNNHLIDYFDLKNDFQGLDEAFHQDKNLTLALKEFRGIRILNQEPFECLISFIISQNNNIPRIKKIINSLSEHFGTKISDEHFAFPTIEQLEGKTCDDLAITGAGFRNKYIVDAVEKISSGQINLNDLKNSSYEKAKEQLMQIKGVGPKVSDCVLLYSLKFDEAFPKDVWVNKVLDELYDGKMPKVDKKYLGIAQQYLFHWRRNSKRFI